MNKLSMEKIVQTKQGLMRYLIILLLIGFSGFATAQEIVEAEYFIDTDPSVGKGTSLSIPSPADTVEQSFDINLNGLSKGSHLLVVRVKDGEGHWSLSKQSRFYVEESYETPKLPTIIAAEYFIDTDPGAGNATAASVGTTSDDVQIDVDYALSSLSAGKHHLCVRVQDEKGNWSIGKCVQFYVEPTYTPTTPDTSTIVAVEYFINSPDPGVGNATAIDVPTPSQNISVEGELDLTTTSLDIGRHQFLVRVKDSRDRWSLLNVRPFDYCSPEGVIGGFEHTLVDNVLSITDTSRNAVSYIWNMGDGEVIKDTLTSYTYLSGGVYEMSQIAYSFCGSDTTYKTITVNTPMVADTIKSMTIDEDAGRVVVSEDLNLNFTDPDGDPFTFTAIAGKEDKLIATVEENKRLVLSTIDNQNGKVSVKITAEAGGISYIHAFTVTIDSINDIPYLVTPIDEVIYDEDSGPRIVTDRLENHFKDYDNNGQYFDSLAMRYRRNHLDFTAESDIPELTPVIFNNDSLIIEMAEDFNGEGYITITATDDSLTSLNYTFKVTILPIMDAPRLLLPIKSIVEKEDPGVVEIVENLNTMFIEPDGESMVFTISSDNPDIQLTKSANTVTLNVTENYHGSANAAISANDGTFTTVDSFRVEILPVNDKPQFSNLGDLAICPESPLQINLIEKVTDEESPVSSLSLSGRILSSSSASVGKNELTMEIDEVGTLTLNSTAITPTDFLIELSAKDPQNATGKDTITVQKYGSTFTQSNDTLIASEGESYQWYLSDDPISGATRKTLVTKGLGEYKVAITTNGCTVISDTQVLTGLEDDLLKANTLVYPNPTTGVFSVQYSSNYLGKVSVRVFDTVGKTIFLNSSVKSHSQFNLSVELLNDAGLYLVEITTDKAKAIKRIIVN
ncbi:T9SS type A sorting domain-containing protein [Flammeovirgaceae bacterium SG7u.111]|nr:T9SS type A sorting domain-containing protein [Flammeovirgaceae bacterium SG7u.132]WPO34906.1 T9SS type A sorting domain-containing protein [Flammeovirgaceae bacterium SG7u.111]